MMMITIPTTTTQAMTAWSKVAETAGDGAPGTNYVAAMPV
jgi:hypothetical protein